MDSGFKNFFWRFLTSIISLFYLSNAFAVTQSILFFGDSLTAGFGVKTEEAFPSLVVSELNRKGYSVSLINAGVSGDTSEQALKRVDWNLKRQKVDYVVLGIGGNDGLRHLPTSQLFSNLEKIVRKFQQEKIQVLLLGMKTPANAGKDYQKSFEQVFRNLSKAQNLPLVPFLLEDVALKTDLNQADGIHPNAKGHKILAGHVLKVLEPLLKKDRQ